MNKPHQPVRIVIAGTGFGGTYTFVRLHRYFHKNPAVQIILINQKNYFLFTPLLHEVATGGVSPENIVEPIRKVIGCCLADFYLTDITAVELRRAQIKTRVGTIPYDYLVLALGSKPNYYGIPGAQQSAFPLKSLDDAIRLKNHLITSVEQATKTADRLKREQLLSFVVVGGGPTGVELSAEMAEFFYKTFKSFYHPTEIIDKIKVILIQKDSELLPNFSVHFRQKSLQILRQKGIEVRLNTQVISVASDRIIVNDGAVIPTKTTIWVAGVKPTQITFDEQVNQDDQGRIVVNDFLQIPHRPAIFVIGDMVHSRNSGSTESFPSLAQVATKQADCVADNVYYLITGQPIRKFSYQHAGDLLSLGHWSAIAEIGRLAFFGHLAWWLWRTVYLVKLISWPKKIKVAVDWTINLFAQRDISQL